MNNYMSRKDIKVKGEEKKSEEKVKDDKRSRKPYKYIGKKEEVGKNEIAIAIERLKEEKKEISKWIIPKIR